MSNEFRPNDYEAHWRKKWEEEELYSIDNPKHKDKPKYYCLDMFPYPSGEGLHVGHWRGYVLSDVWARYKMLQGYNVLHPMGWDNFGLPAENDAIKNGVHPRIRTEKNIDNMRRQLKEIGCIYDWNREFATTDTDYYKWTQFIFLKMFEKGLAYQKEQPVNWCNECKVVLANEEVEGGKCERCGGSNIEKRFINQWMLKITEYADRLLEDLDGLKWPDKVKEMQRNWIGKSTGARVIFETESTDGEKMDLEVFTTRPDTLFGATFMVVAPEHPMLEKIVTAENRDAVMEYKKKAQLLSNVDRQVGKDKTGVFTGAYGINPVNGTKVPIWVSDYVLMDYGTGAIMAVPAHDERDFAFATKYNIPIIEVIGSENAVKDAEGNLTEAYVGDGKIVNSEYINGLSVSEAKEAIIEKLKEAGKGEKTINYKLRDWIFARQRYWGEPIPIIHCEKCGTVPVPYDQLPVMLPDVESYRPTDDGKSPLSRIESFVNTTCPKCGGHAKRETDTMPQWAGSSWYFLRYPDKFNDKELASMDVLKEWAPIDMYVGGIEHAVLHLLYARFWTKFLYDEGLVPFNEPFTELFNQGMVCRRAHRCHPCNRWVYDNEIKYVDDKPMCPDCGNELTITVEKMSKSKGNGVSPDELVKEYGTDSLRLYELFTGDPSMDSEWNDDGIKACYNLLKKAWNFVTTATPASESSKEAKVAINKLIMNVDKRINMFKLNTAVSAFMEFVNEANPIKDQFSKEDIEKFVVTMAAFAPHFSEEIWRNLFEKANSVFDERFPSYDESVLVTDSVEIVVQVNGKVKAKLVIAKDADKESVAKDAMANEVVKASLEGKTIVKEIYVPGKIYNIVVR